MELTQFATGFCQDVFVRAVSADGESFREDAFTDLMIEHLCDSGVLDDAQVCSQRGHGWKVNGFGLSMGEECLDLLVSHYSGIAPPVRISNTDVKKALGRLFTFFQSSINPRFYQSLPESSPVFDLALRINELAQAKSLERVRLFLLTDCVARTGALEDVDDFSFAGLKVSVSAQVWDIERLFRSFSSGQRREAIRIDFVDQFKEALPCLAMPDDDDTEYNTYLALVSGHMLYDIYARYGPRLLERNVRSFLQAKGSVNQAIRRTIRETPRMFLAYNNGISATAEAIEAVQLGANSLAIKAVTGFQIVNGGQTTASIYHAVNQDKASLEGLYVQMKLTVLKDISRMDDVVPAISQSANTQNKVQLADFSANHPFHRAMEELSRTVWAPSAVGTEKQTHWFYERARGQYADERARAGTPAKKKAFEQQNPPKQRLTKVDLAKFEHSWQQRPHHVSEGAQKNFGRFMIDLEHCPIVPDQDYFHKLIAKAILFKRMEDLFNKLALGPYRANVVPYTIAWLCMKTAQDGKRVDLDRIWQSQRLNPKLEEAIIQVLPRVHYAITHPPSSANITEWCKREACWRSVSSIDIELSPAFHQQLVPLSGESQAPRRRRSRSAG